MAVGQGSDITDVLCLHQPVTVPPELSDEGNYSVLLLFDTVSDSLQVNDEEAQESDRNEERARNDDGDDNDVTNYNQERHRHSPEMPPNEYGGDDWARRHCCSALSTAMVHLLTASTVNTEGAAHFLHEENELKNGGGLRWREFEMGSVEKLAAGSTTIGQAEGAGRTRRRATQSLDGWPPPSVKLEDRTPTISTPAVVSTRRRWSGDMAAAEDVSRAMDVAVGYSSEDFSPGPRGDLVQSLEHMTTDACGTENVVDPIEKKSEELVGDGGLVCSEPREDVHIRQYAPGDNFAEQVDEIGGGRDPIDCDNDDDGGSGGDPYEDDFFSDVSSPSFDKVDTNGSITGKSTDGVMQDSTDTAAEQSRESKTLESGPMSPVTMVTAARDWQDGGGIQSPPLWRETDADDPCWSVSPGVRWPSGDGLSSEEGPGGGSVGKGGGGDNVPPPVSEQIERGSSWSDGIVEYDESWVASGARDNIRDSGTTKSRDGRDDGGGGGECHHTRTGAVDRSR